MIAVEITESASLCISNEYFILQLPRKEQKYYFEINNIMPTSSDSTNQMVSSLGIWISELTITYRFSLTLKSSTHW